MRMNPSPSPATERAEPHAAATRKFSAADLWPTLLLLLFAAGYRVWLAWQTTHSNGGMAALFSWLPGFCPLAALTLCGGWFLPRRLALVAPMAVLLVTDLALTAIYGWQPLGGGEATATVVQMLSRYVVLLALGAWALGMRRGADGPAALRWAPLLATTLAGSCIFYVVTNTFSWLTLPGYSLTAAGWWQALTTGLPGYPPSWTFFRNALFSDLLYTALMLVAVRTARRGENPVQGISRPARPNATAAAH
jgi:hypothetical protein